MTLFPLFLKLAGRRCLVVGAGAIGEEKIEGLLPTGAEIVVVAPDATSRVRELARSRRIHWEQRKFRTSDLKDVFLIVAATSSHALHKKIYRESLKRKILCNVVDDPPHCDFYYGSVVRRGALQIAISTAGQSPALSQRIRKNLEREFGPEFEEWIELLGKAREKLFAKTLDANERKRLLHVLASEEMFQEFLRGRKK